MKQFKMRSRRSTSILSHVGAGLLLTLLVAGCGGGGPKGPVGTVHGKVTYKQQSPPAGTTITFLGEKTGSGAAKTEADGSYRLAGSSGLLPLATGLYRVIVTLPVKEVSIEDGMRASQSGAKTTPEAGSFPAKYSNPSETPASVEIKEGDNEYNLDMVDS